MSSTNKWLNKAQIAAYRGVKVRTIEQWMAARLIPYFKAGSSKQTPVRFDRDAVDAALAKFNREVRS